MSKIRLRKRGVIATPPVFTTAAFPSATWNGTNASGWTVENPAPVATSHGRVAPVVKNIFADGRRIVANHTVACIAKAKGGIKKVRLHFEGNIFENEVEEMRTRTDVNGIQQKNVGYFFDIDHAACIAQHASINNCRYYFEAIPNDPSMPSAIDGPFYIYPETNEWDRVIEIKPSATSDTVGFVYRQIKDAITWLRGQASMHNVDIVLKESGLYYLYYRKANTGMGARRGRFRIRAEAGINATIGGSSTWADTEGDTLYTYGGYRVNPRCQGFWFQGNNLTVDFAWMRYIDEPSAGSHLIDGINITNSRGENSTILGTFGSSFNGVKYFQDCYLENLSNSVAGSRSVINCTFYNVANDIFQNSQCVQGNVGSVSQSYKLKRFISAIKITYNGAGSATIRRQGTGTSPNRNDTTAVVTLTDPNGSATYTCVQPYTHNWTSAGTIGHFADFVNSRAGWTAELLVENLSDGDRRMASMSIIGFARGGDFGNQTVNSTTGVTLGGSFEIHPDWYQIVSQTSPMGNRYMGYNKFWTGAYQTIFFSDQPEAWNVCVENNAFHLDTSQESYYSQMDGKFYHLMFWNNSLLNQGFRVTNASYTDFDSYCEMTGNYFGSSVFTSAHETRGFPDMGDLNFSDNHVVGGIDPLISARGTNNTSGGAWNVDHVSANTGDFTIAGTTLPNNTINRITKWDVNFNQRLPVDVKGAVKG